MADPTRQLLWTRAQGYCDVCGRPMSEVFAVHHRQLGDRSNNSLSNLLICHHDCHNGRTTSIHLSPMRAYRAGWLVRRHAKPAEVPVLMHGAWWAFLHDDGSYSKWEGFIPRDFDATSFAFPAITKDFPGRPRPLGTDDPDGDRTPSP